MKTTILLADDFPSVRQLLRTILEEHDGLQVVGEAENGRMAIQLARELRPEVVIMDLAMPELDGIEATRWLLADQPDVRVIIHSAHSDPFLVERAFGAGARGYVLKDDAVAEMPETVRAIVSGQTYRSSSIRGVAPDARDLPWVEVANARNRPAEYP